MVALSGKDRCDCLYRRSPIASLMAVRCRLKHSVRLTLCRPRKPVASWSPQHFQKAERRVKAQSADPARKLDGFIDALTAVLALQSVSGGCTCDHILSNLGEALLRILDLRLVFVRLRSWPDGVQHEALSLDSRYRERGDEAALITALQPWLSPPLGSASSLKYKPMGPEAISITSLELGSNGAWGRLVAGAPRASFPSDLEWILLRVAANQACVALMDDLHPTTVLDRTEEERYKLAAVVQNCFDFIGISTLAGKAMFVNPAGRRMVGLRDDEPIPREISSYVADEAQERFKESLLAVEQEGFWDGQATFRHFPSGAAFPVLQHIFYICEPNTGRRLALATVCRDISERRRTELKLSKAQQDLAHASRVLSIGELTASLAHEINQPLAAIVTNANSARRWLEPTVRNYKRARRSLESIVRDANRASVIIRRVRSFSAKTTPSRSALDINEVIREVVAFATHEISREHVALTTRLEERLPIVIADRVELQQVVLNLVINSIEALRPVVGRRKELVIKSARRNRGTLEVSVRDNGTGIEPQHLARMFEAFFTTRSNGMGLGLAISRRIVESYDGTLRVSRNPRRGLTMTFTLPLLNS
jgi:PAS domain S-box-containing protein